MSGACSCTAEWTACCEFIFPVAVNLRPTGSNNSAVASASGGLISKGHFDLIISDWNMEPMGGEQLLEQVRGDKKIRGFAFYHDDCRVNDRQDRQI